MFIKKTILNKVIAAHIVNTEDPFEKKLQQYFYRD